ncbi:MAG: HypC/HybG/HupF family hydrogenase formation chaperone [Burkholderiaceae bacterium]
MCLGIPGQIVEVTDPVKKLAIVNVAGVRRTINIGCIVSDDRSAQSCLGDWVLVHVGFAMSRIDEDEAARTLELLTQIGEVQAELDAMHASARA